ncbi:MAG: FkbH-like protein, partial [Thermoplasmata archaeon]
NKSQNIIEIANELNVGIDSMIFFDDSHFEINLVKDTLENIDVIKLDSNNPINNLGIIERLPFLNSIKITIEDENKSSQYLSEQKRITIRKTTATVDDFIESLEINISYWINNKSQLARITQLVNKTNQFNLTTKRYSESEISHFMNFNQVFSFQIKDKFGDMGITAVVIVIDNKIDTFLMSCRILGRKIEEKIMKIILNQTTKPLSAEYIRTSKNSQVENLYDKFGFRLVSKDKSKNVYILEMQ